ncbi:MAG TPA: DUF5666 domain-containing protein [Terriglobales bacterium]|nr:DUF5666 domain-containing protein [Terriglobales bacterium]
MKRVVAVSALLALLGIAVACGNSSSSSQTGPQNDQPGGVFVTGEDAPLPSVLAFNTNLDKMTLNNGSTSVTILSTSQTVDFARLLGLRTLVGFSPVTPGTYSSATIQLSNPVISYLDLGTSPPSVATMSGTLTRSTVTVALSKPLVVGQNGLAGLHMEFDLRQSLQVDSNTGQLTGVVNPQFDLRPVKPADPDAEITDLRGGLVSVGSSSFVLQRIGGHDITIDVNSDTQYSGTNSLSTLIPPAVIEVDGIPQGDGSVLAREVEVITTDKAFLSGRIVTVNPSSGPAQTVTLLVGEELPAISNIQVGFPVTLDVSGVTDYDIRHFDTFFTEFLFNASSMVVGQRIAVGGSLDANQNFVPARIVLRRQGTVGDLVLNSVTITSGNRGSFELQNHSLFGYLLGTPLMVETGDNTLFLNINGLSGIQSGGSMTLAASGLILKDPTSGNPQLWAHTVAVLP